MAKTKNAQNQPAKDTKAAETKPESAVPDALKEKAETKAAKQPKETGRGRKVLFPGNSVIKVLSTDTKIKAGTTRHKIFLALVGSDGKTIKEAREKSPAAIGAWDIQSAIDQKNIKLTIPEPKPAPEPKAEDAPAKATEAK